LFTDSEKATRIGAAVAPAKRPPEFPAAARLYYVKVLAVWRLPVALLMLSTSLAAQSHTAPAGIRPPARRPGASILPGGRVIAPLGQEYATGPGAFGLAVSPSGKSVATANAGPWVYSLTVLEKLKSGRFENRQIVAGNEVGATTDWKSVSGGIAFAGERGLYIAEGNSGRASFFDSSDERRRIFELNQNGYHDSFAGELAFDAERSILYAVDQANFRVAVIDVKSRQILTSVKVGRLPFALTLSPDRRKLYVTNAGMFEYRAIPGADIERPGAPALPFPAFGFPSAESFAGVERMTERGAVQVPGLGDPNVRESNSLCVIDVANPAEAKVETFIRTGLPAGEQSAGGSGPSAVLATAERIFVSNANQDSITVIDARTGAVETEIPIRIPGLETLRGVLPLGMAYHANSGWLLVAEAGINAVGVIDVRARRVLGHIPAAWFPTRVAIDHDTVFVANAKGHGVGPNVAAWNAGGPPPYSQLYQGTLSVFLLPHADALPAHTALVMEANGFLPARAAPAPLPDGVRHVVLIVKESRSYDEVLGDVGETASGPAMGARSLARLGGNGYVDGRRERVSIRGADITPNHHAIARQWTFSDNFYADSEGSVDGHHWLAGVYPNAWTETSVLAAFGDRKDFRLGAAPGRLAFAGTAASVQPEDQAEGGTIWSHLAKHGVSFYNFGEGFELAGTAQGRGLEPTGARLFTNMPMPEALYRNTSRDYPGFNIHIPDQYRASQLIHEIDRKYVRTHTELPRFLYIHLPNDYMAAAQPADGYPYEESFMADNDYALGRLIEYFSGTPWWRDMVVFVTEDDAAGGVDHIDAHRTLMLCAGPWARRGYVSHVNASFPALWKTIFRLLRVPPLNLFDAAASDLADCLTAKPDFTGFHAFAPDKRIFDPSQGNGRQ
jgi:DNA-binding beta-propeller fold protein YncE